VQMAIKQNRTAVRILHYFRLKMCYTLLFFIIITTPLSNGRLYGIMVGVPGYRTEMYCVSCEIRTESIYVM
jgi:hypothetical protein